MSAKIFLDTNIWVYAKIRAQDKSKHQKAVTFLKNNSDRIIISTQVLNEFYNIMSKNRIQDDLIQSAILSFLPDVDLCQISLSTIRKSWEIRSGYFYSIYDSLIIASALESDCEILYTEDLQHNQLINNKLRIINPFCD